MEQNATTTMPVMDSGKQDNGKGWKIATAIASVVAVCGIGFGVYAFLNSSNTTSQMDDYKKQVTILQEQISNLQSQSVSIQENNENNTGSCKIIDGYLHIEEWGYKIKIPNYDENSSTTSILRCEYVGENDIEQPADAALQIFSFNYKYGNRPSVDYSIYRQKGESDWEKIKSQNWMPIGLDDGWEYRIYYSVPDESVTKEKIEIFTDRNNYIEI